jgi:VWFA-related protein
MAGAQQKGRTPEQTNIPTFSQEVSVSVVNLYASVRNARGRPVHGLRQQDFRLFINGRRQIITNFSSDVTEPLNLVFLLDVSGSMRMMNKFETAKGIIRKVIEQLSSEDEAALLIFADGEVEMLIDFTTDKRRIIERMEQLKAYGGTALRNAIAYCHRLLINNIGKKGVLLLSDGVDTRSDLTMVQAMDMAAKVELPIYTFELVRNDLEVQEGKEKEVDELPLKAFAEATGGLYFRLDEASEKDVSKACAKIFDDLKYQYYIGYTPHDSDSSYGRVQLRTKDPRHRVRVRYSVVPGG